MDTATKQEDQLKTVKILIADDDPPTRILLKAAISQWGYEVIEAQDGEEAWALINEKNSPEIVILDWLMPKLDGIALCERIKQSNVRHPYIILLTQISGTPNIIKGLEAGADEFLSKPFNMAELRSRLAVGAKIVTHQNEIRFSILKIEELISNILETSQQIDDLLKAHPNLEQDEHLKKIIHLHSNLKEKINSLQQFNLSKK